MKNNNKYISGGVLQIFLLVAVIFLFRIIYVDLYRYLNVSQGYSIYSYLFTFITDWLSMGLGVIANILFITWFRKKIPHGKKPIQRVLFLIIYLIVISLLLALLVSRRQDWSLYGGAEFNIYTLLLIFLAVLLVNAIFVVLVDLVLYLRQATKELDAEKNKKRKAQYQYTQLKQQLNPHFLFNSLNILDYLVQNEENERASQFISKMAKIYRYMLTEAENKLVLLKEELDFTNMYVDLLKERFIEGLEVEVDIPKSHYKDHIVPCGLQLLVENATKHNIVDAEHILHIDIYCENDWIVVRNNKQLRMSREESTGVGLTNIRRQYMDIANAEIVIEDTSEHFTVKLPLLK